MATALDVITNALVEIGAYAAGEVPSGADSSHALSRLNRLIDSWNAERPTIFSQSIATYDLVASTQSRTIGPTGNYVVAVRPMEIVRANLISGSDRYPVNVRDSAWWMEQDDRSITTLPTDLYYNPTFPNGTLYFWPIPDSSSYDIELETRSLLSTLAALATTFSMPPGYEEAITQTLAELLCPVYGKPLTAELAESARKARAVIKGANSRAPRIGTDSGLGGSGKTFNPYTGQA